MLAVPVNVGVVLLEGVDGWFSVTVGGAVLTMKVTALLDAGGVAEERAFWVAIAVYHRVVEAESPALRSVAAQVCGRCRRDDRSFGFCAGVDLDRHRSGVAGGAREDGVVMLEGDAGCPT